MLNGLVGKKLGMTGLYDEKGNRIPVTVIELGPVFVVQKKNKERDGYEAVQVAFEEIKSKGKKNNVPKAISGHFKDVPLCKHLREFKADTPDSIEIGQVITADIFKKDDYVDVIGNTKGRGFSGVIKRHGFHGGPASHGHRFHRTTGAIGNRSTPGRVFKNKRMPGQFGNTQVTMRALKIIDLNAEQNVVYIKGAVPGPTGRLVEVVHTKKHI